MSDNPAPTVLYVSIEPKTKADQEKLGQGLPKLMAEDPTFRVQTDRRRTAQSARRRLSSRRGHIQSLEDRGGTQIVQPDGLHMDDQTYRRVEACMPTLSNW